MFTCTSITDYRGPQGVWTLQAKGQKAALSKAALFRARPTVTHMAITQMVKSGLVHYVLTQNVDGLHRKAGLTPMTEFVELHGCTFVEKCRTCKRFYERQYRTRSRAVFASHHHQTSNKCEMCGGVLCDTIVTFGECCDKAIWALAESQSMAADLYIAVGSSLSLSHIAMFPLYAQDEGEGNFVIINLMKVRRWPMSLCLSLCLSLAQQLL
jgi:NAD+-dependent protein deacetylase sirtuin 6